MLLLFQGGAYGLDGNTRRKNEQDPGLDRASASVTGVKRWQCCKMKVTLDGYDYDVSPATVRKSRLIGSLADSSVR